MHTEMLSRQTQLSCLFLSYFVLIISFTPSFSVATIPRWNQSDRSALLALKSDIVKDPSGALSSWTDSLHHCHWQGIICSRLHPDRVTALNLTSLKLEGTLSPYIGNISFLRRIDLSRNNFQGQIPPQIGRLFRLQILSLHDNFFRGGIPSSLTRCSHLVLINLNFNNLSGNILPELSSLSQLEGLGLAANNFIGSIPSSFGNLSSLNRLSLWNNHLEGNIPGDLCHMRNLTFFQVGDNYLKGELPSCLYNHSNIMHLLVAYNQLKGNLPSNIGHNLPRLQVINLYSNKFDGPLPLSSLCYATRLETIDFSDNSFSGEIPTNLTHCSNLLNIGLGNNMLSGKIPTSFGNLSSLSYLLLYGNHFEGNIPDEICRITSLSSFQVFYNNLEGQLPSCLYNLSNMEYLGVSGNKLEGSLPPYFGITLPKIKQIFFTINKFTGHIPISLSNATELELCDFSSNHFTGPVPKHLGRLQGLRKIGFGENNLGTQVGNDLEFITSLTNCTILESIAFQFNMLKGPLPVSISNLSTTLVLMSSQDNLIYGNIPVGIGNLINVQILSLATNHLTGSIPPVIGNLNRLRKINLGENKLSGKIPIHFGNLTQLTHLSLGANDISGTIPSSLENCQKLEFLELSQNRLVGTIPNQLTYLSLLTIGLHLDHNFLIGSLPSNFSNMSKLTILDVSENKLSGHLPESLGDCLNLVELSMAGNFFEAEIPKSLIALKGLQRLDLSNNNLFGDVPEYLDQFPLVYLNLSFNKLQGPVPKSGIFANASAISLVGNKDLCGGIQTLRLPPCITERKKSSFSIWVIVPVTVGTLFLFISLYLVFRCLRRKMFINRPSSTTFFNHHYQRISYADLLKATNGFSTENILGVGGYGTVFKGVIQEVNQTVAVKVLNLQQKGVSKTFLRECNVLKNVRHRNLLKILTTCSSIDFQGNDFRALVFEFMSNGCLNEWIHPREEEGHVNTRSLNFVQRLGIIADVASALEYLHHQQTPLIVHCDLKPSNVLLDDDMAAHVADFGLAKIFSSTSSNDLEQSFASSLLFKGSLGYIAPEYGMGSEVSTKGDVYSYGILLLELFTRKKPTDESSLRGLSLHDYSKMAIPHQVMEIVDPVLLVVENDGVFETVDQNNMKRRLQDSLVSVIKLGVQCSVHSPTERMTMIEVVNELDNIKNHYHGVREFRVCLDQT